MGKRLKLAVTALLALAVAGCGSDQADGATTSAVLVFDTETCRNEGTVEALGAVWELAEPVPFAWRGSGERDGVLAVTGGQDAEFTADDGTRLRVTTGPHEDVCHTWH